MIAPNPSSGARSRFRSRAKATDPPPFHLHPRHTLANSLCVRVPSDAAIRRSTRRPADRDRLSYALALRRCARLPLTCRAAGKAGQRPADNAIPTAHTARYSYASRPPAPLVPGQGCLAVPCSRCRWHIVANFPKTRQQPSPSPSLLLDPTPVYDKGSTGAPSTSCPIIAQAEGASLVLADCSSSR